jgi:hypothetical protein
VFDKLKITATSLKIGCKFALKFVLLKFENAKFLQVPKFYVISQSIEVYSHTVYLTSKNSSLSGIYFLSNVAQFLLTN